MKECVELVHFAWCDNEGCEVGVCGSNTMDQPVESAIGIMSYLRGRTPEDDRWAGGAVEELLGFSDETNDTGVSNNTEAGFVTHISLKPRRRCIIHADHALGMVNLCSCTSAQYMTWACHQGTLAAV